MNWQIGDRAIFVASCADSDPMNKSGIMVTLARYAGDTIAEFGLVENAWEITTGEFVNEQCLQKPYDGYEKVSFENSAWQPRELATNE